MQQPEPDILADLARKHSRAARAIGIGVGLSAALTLLGSFATSAIHRPLSDSVTATLWVVLFLVSLLAFVYKRAMFAASRLHDLAVIKGLGAVVQSLQHTTIQLAFIGIAIALLGFIITIGTGNWFDMLRAGAVAVIVQLYSYPQRSAWTRLVNSLARADRGQSSLVTKGT